ncbi:T9SS type A sorting domain-containing protein [Hymenobacter convexus]|uniref:T9SS type A sorting domain-containing protein n=1 Tax=Hymenobacter sp. CA1UV-4 TaxID=3063782 RepID=UPI0027124845|nr:T9SS type A sorting domain-containing protein [Hymenobacter sp. CA1UV-4]MDO7854202.1 T9SS type A sorting domain-containing protein [Hymenobacter sp. CA1UV-4]
MRLFYLSIQVALLGIFFIGATAFSGVAQPWQYASTVYSASNASNEPLAVDGSLATAARIEAPALLGAARLRIAFPSTVRSGGRAGLVIQMGSNVDLGVLNGTSIRTYMNGSSGYEQNISVASLLDLNVTGSNKVAVEFPVTSDFNQIEVRTAGLINASVSVDIFAAYGTITPLPVELVTFQGKASTAGVSLTWNTASERNNDHFVVERTNGASDVFYAIGQVKGAGSSNQSHQYRFVDAAPKPMSYYRLRQVDADGKETFSPIVVVKSDIKTTELAAYPSPAAEMLTVAGAAGTSFGVFNQFGQKVQEAKVTLELGQQLDVRSLPNGVYFLRDMATGQSTRFVKAAATR